MLGRVFAAKAADKGGSLVVGITSRVTMVVPATIIASNQGLGGSALDETRPCENKQQ